MNWYKMSKNIDYGLMQEVEQASDSGDIHNMRNLMSVYTLNIDLYNKYGKDEFLNKAEEARTELKKYLYKKRKNELV